MNSALEEVPPDYLHSITIILDSNDPEDMSRLEALLVGFQRYIEVEYVDGRFLRVTLYPGLAKELPQ